MDPYDGSVLGKRFDPQWEPIRLGLGYARRLADRLDLAAMAPHDELASTKYCLASPGKAYVVYVPNGGIAKVSLGDSPGRLAVQWMNPATGKMIADKPVDGGGDREFKSPLAGDAVLYLTRV